MGYTKTEIEKKVLSLLFPEKQKSRVAFCLSFQNMVILFRKFIVNCQYYVPMHFYARQEITMSYILFSY